MTRAFPAAGARAPVRSVLLAAAMAVSACGSSRPPASGLASKSPQQIVAAARSAVASAATAHVYGSIAGAGKPISIDMELVAGKGGMGTVTVDGMRLDLVTIESETYIRGEPAFYERIAGTAAARILAGRWLKVPATAGRFASLSSLGNLQELIDTALASHGQLTRAPGRPVAGQSTVAVADPSGGGTLYVASSGTPYPLEIDGTGRGSGRIYFDRWDRPVTLTVPEPWVNIEALNARRAD